MSGSKWLADKALAQLRNVPRITIPALNEVGRKPVSQKSQILNFKNREKIGHLRFFAILGPSGDAHFAH